MCSVFVYGTLKPGEAYYRQYCQPYVVGEAIPAIVQGCLFHLPLGYPAMTLGNGWVTGALLRIGDEQAIAYLDEFEDYDPNPLSTADNLYTRQLRSVFSPKQQPLGRAWMYVMQVEKVQQYGGIPIPAGNWSRHQWPSIE